MNIDSKINLLPHFEVETAVIEHDSNLHNLKKYFGYNTFKESQVWKALNSIMFPIYDCYHKLESNFKFFLFNWLSKNEWWNGKGVNWKVVVS